MIVRVLPPLLLVLLAGCGAPPLSAPVEDLETSAAPAPAVVEEKPELPANRPRYHVVSAGETLSSIALNYGLDYRELAQWNKLRNPDLIQVETELRLFPPENAPVVSVVKPGESSALKVVESGEAGGTAGGADLSPPSAAAAAADDDSAAAVVSVRKGETTRIGAAAAATTTPDTPIKTGPRAVKYIYSPSMLKRLREQWGRDDVSVVPKKTVAVASAPAAEQAPPRSVRRRFGVDWSWPAHGAVIQKFNEAGKGVDFAGDSGDIVYASAAGKVIYVNTGIKSYGLLIIIKHDNDYLTAYAHNDKAFVKEGQRVSRGDKIAAFGKSGADRVKMHFEVRKAGKPFDPMQVLPPSADDS